MPVWFNTIWREDTPKWVTIPFIFNHSLFYQLGETTVMTKTPTSPKQEGTRTKQKEKLESKTREMPPQSLWWWLLSASLSVDELRERLWCLDVRNRRTHPMCSSSLSETSPLAGSGSELLVCCRGMEWSHLALRDAGLAPNSPSSWLWTGIVESAWFMSSGLRCLASWAAARRSAWSNLLGSPEGGETGLCLAPSQLPDKNER